MIVTLGGQVERLIGVVAALALRWGLDPARLGVYTGLRLFLDNTNRSSLGVGLGAVQQIPILRASGRDSEARHLANVAHSINILTCLLYALGLVGLAVYRSRAGPTGPFQSEWTWGLLIVAGLALLKRQESFLVAVLRAHQEYNLTTRADILESILMAAGVVLGLWSFGIWGLLAAISVVLVSKIVYLQARHPLRFRWAWDLATAWRLMATGLPILANTVAFGCVLGLDRAVILTTFPEGERAAGLYSVALLGTSWCLDLAGRVVLVLYTYFQVTFGRDDDPARVAEQAGRATEAQAAVLAPLAAAAFVIGPCLLGWVVPRYADGVPAFRPLLPGALLLSLAWPARQMLIAVGRPVRLLIATLLGLLVATVAVLVGGREAGLVGISAGMTVGAVAVLLCTSAAAYIPTLGGVAWVGHLAALGRVLAWHAAGAWAAAAVPLPTTPGLLDAGSRLFLLSLWSGPFLLAWLVRQSDDSAAQALRPSKSAR
jgi:O-antigen/teichoic acid export membrane protein